MDIYGKVADDYYKSKLPTSLTKEQLADYQKRITDLDNVPLTVADRKAKIVEIDLERVAAIDAIKAEFYNDRNRLETEFEADAEEYFEFKNMPEVIRRKIHNMAREDSRSLGSRLSEYEKLAPLAELCWKTAKEQQP